MLTQFFLKVKEGGVPASVRELLTLLEAMKRRVIFGTVEDFYYLARASLVKDEKYYDRFDRVFAAYFKGIVDLEGMTLVVPEEWLKKLAEKVLTEEDKKLIEAMGPTLVCTALTEKAELRRALLDAGITHLTALATAQRSQAR